MREKISGRWRIRKDRKRNMNARPAPLFLVKLIDRNLLWMQKSTSRFHFKSKKSEKKALKRFRAEFGTSHARRYWCHFKKSLNTKIYSKRTNCWDKQCPQTIWKWTYNNIVRPFNFNTIYPLSAWNNCADRWQRDKIDGIL